MEFWQGFELAAILLGLPLINAILLVIAFPNAFTVLILIVVIHVDLFFGVRLLVAPESIELWVYTFLIGIVSARISLFSIPILVIYIIVRFFNRRRIRKEAQAAKAEPETVTTNK